MKGRFSIWILMGSVGLWGLLSAILGPGFVMPGFWGMAGPLLMGVITVELVVRTFNRSPEKLTNMMIKSFAGKMIFYALYVVVVLTTTSLDAMIFVFSFSGFFILLHMVEALYFRAKFKAH